MDIRKRLLLLSGKKRGAPNAVKGTGAAYAVSLSSDAALDDLHGGAFTVELWFYQVSDTGTFRFIISKNYYGSTGWYICSGGASQLVANIDYSTTDASAWPASSFGNWHHYAMTFDAGGDAKARIYVDGNLVATSVAAAGTPVSDAAYDIKLMSNNVGGCMVGWTRISNFVRYTVNFIPVGRLTPPETDANTIALWKMNEGTGTVLDNAEGTSTRDGIIVNGIWVYSP